MSYEIVFGSLGPALPLTLTSGSSVFELQLGDTVTLRYNDPEGGTHEVAMEITNAAAGEVEYKWVEGDLPAVGVYRGQVVVERAGDATFPRTFPSNGQRVLWWVHSSV